MPDREPLLISALPPSRAHKRAALGVAVFLLAAFLVTVPFASVPLQQINVFIPLVATVMFLNDSITASLPLAQFSVVRSRALLVLANGYLFTALLIVPYALTFQGAFSPTGLFGAGLQTPGWLFVIWHIGLPTSVIVYSLLRGAKHEAPQVSGSLVRPFILISIVGNVLIVLAMTWFVIRYQDILPVMVTSLNRTGWFWHYMTAIILTSCLTAVILLWRRGRSVLDLWLLVVSLAWLLDSILLNLLGGRYDLGWYANRFYGILSATIVLLVLLSESTMLYAQLAISVLAQRREREGRLMSMDAMSAAIAHEIKQPLGAIVTNANAGQRWLSRTPPALDKIGNTFKDIAADGHRANEVIQSVRAMFATGEQSRTLLDANELIRETIALVRAELEAAKVAIQLELDAKLPSVSAHRGQLQQVILNVVTNAADAMRSVMDRARVLRIESKHLQSNGLEVSVKDSGTGIESKNIDRIFEPFFTTKSNGMGMGLAICRSIVEAHGGTLSVSAGAPHGCVFRIVLPSNQ
jgi:signal transduction histidine kinase